jgi:hypothetical protein
MVSIQCVYLPNVSYCLIHLHTSGWILVTNALLHPQKMVDTVQSWPEYHELLEIVQEKVVDVDRIIELIRKLYLRGNIFNDWKCNRNYLFYNDIHKIPWCWIANRSDISTDKHS